jgi:inhibitor of cysteine peptidase
MKKIKNFLFIPVFALSLLWQISSNAMAEELKYANPNQLVVVTPVQREVTIGLPANPSTGYQWMLRNYDSTLMATPSGEYLPGRIDKMGSPGVSVWRFKFKKQAFKSLHKTAVVLVYKRPWEKSAIKKQVIHFVIRED